MRIVPCLLLLLAYCAEHSWSSRNVGSHTAICAVRSSIRARCAHCCCWAAGLWLWCCRSLEVSTLCGLLLFLSGRWPVHRATTQKNVEGFMSAWVHAFDKKSGRRCNTPTNTTSHSITAHMGVSHTYGAWAAALER